MAPPPPPPPPPPAAAAGTCCTGLLLAHRAGVTCLGVKSPAERDAPADRAARAAHHTLRGLRGAPVDGFFCAGSARYDTADAAALLADPPICAGFELLSIAAAAEAAARAGGGGGGAAGAERPPPLAAAFISPDGAKASRPTASDVEVIDVTIINSLLASARRNAAAAWRTAAALASGGGGGDEPEESA